MCAGRYRWRLDEVVHGLEGDSFFIASKAANFDAVVPSVIGPAPLWIKAGLRPVWVVFGTVPPKRAPASVTGHPPAPDGTHSSQRPSATP